MESVSKSLPLIMGNQESAVEAPIEAPVEPDKKPSECGEICVIIMTKLEGSNVKNEAVGLIELTVSQGVGGSTGNQGDLIKIRK